MKTPMRKMTTTTITMTIKLAIVGGQTADDWQAEIEQTTQTRRQLVFESEQIAACERRRPVAHSQ